MNLEAREIYKKGLEKDADHNKLLDELIKKDETGRYISDAGEHWPSFDYKKGLEAIIKKDEDGEYIYRAGLYWLNFDYKKGLDALIKKNKTGEFIYGAGEYWKFFDHEKGLDALKNTKYYNDALIDWPKGIDGTKKITQELRNKSKKLPNKKLKLEDYKMNEKKFSKLLKLFKNAIEYKRKKVNEAIEKYKGKEVSATDKRKALKSIYGKVLKGTPYERNIPVFMELIDQVPEDYIDYELKINMKDAFNVVDELIQGKGELTQSEMANLANIISGVGIPAIEKHAAGKNLLKKETGKFGAEAINKNAEEFLKSLKSRRNPKYQIEAPKSKDIIPQQRGVGRRDFLDKIKKDLTIKVDPGSPFYRTMSKLDSKGINVERLAKSMQSATKYSEAKEKAKKELEKQGKSLEDLHGTDDLFNIFNTIKKSKQEAKIKR
jgi:hypothetical protein